MEIKNYLNLLRVKHWLKNLLVLFPLVFSGDFFIADKLFLGIGAFVSFCLVSSAVYVINDLRDIEADKIHPRKCNRPLASGAVSISFAIVLMVLCILLSALLVVFWAINPLLSGIYIGLYFTLNLGYSFGLKNVPIIDIGILASGFLLRVLFGGEYCGIPVSAWLFLTILALAFFFALGKRRGELLHHGSGMRKSLKAYSSAFLDKNLYVFLALGLVFYSLWTFERIGDFSADVNLGSVAFVLGVPLVMLVCMRYSLDIESGESDGDPVEVLLSDKALFVYILVWAADMLVSLYMGT